MPTIKDRIRKKLDNTFGVFLQSKNNLIYLNIRNQALTEMRRRLKE